jgi:hypothetical protein
MARKSRNPAPTCPENGLTPIPLRIHCPATTERIGGNDELDQIAIEHFLDTLAEVALAIASRKLCSELAEGRAKEWAGGGELG